MFCTNRLALLKKYLLPWLKQGILFDISSLFPAHIATDTLIPLMLFRNFMKGLRMSPLLFGMIGSPVQLIVIALIAFLLFGNRLPSVMRSLGRSVTEFKKGVSGIEEEVDAAVKEASKKTANDKKDDSEE